METIGIIIAGLLLGKDLILDYTLGEEIYFNQRLLIRFGYYCMYSIAISIVNSYFFEYINHKVVWTEATKKYRLVTGILGSISSELASLVELRLVCGGK